MTDAGLAERSLIPRDATSGSDRREGLYVTMLPALGFIKERA
jgi:hypothetical protein